MMQRLLLWVCVSLILSSAEIYLENPLWWCMVALLMCIEYLARKEGAHDARVECLDALLLAKHELDAAHATETALRAQLQAVETNNTLTKDTL